MSSCILGFQATHPPTRGPLLESPESPKFMRTKKIFYIRKESNSHTICLEHQHGRRDVMWKRSIFEIMINSGRVTCSFFFFYLSSYFYPLACVPLSLCWPLLACANCAEVAHRSFCVKFTDLISKLNILEKSTANIQRTDLYLVSF